MEKILQFHSMAGTFYVLQVAPRDYIMQFDERLFEDTHYRSIDEAVDSFVNESGFFILHPELGYPLDLFDLGVPDDISGWQGVQ
ncbi:MAG TPA: hypothetical protein ENK65_01340 [Helicobacteraceae bacterium]|nr:hypothetical protein [Helicobacteraceae bacterium]